ncbi:GGDEF domain-containing protein [Marinicellulosiphila megalodicopiae]|uniref:GGDEF domain-containing protein n=1 Tax=Marinicellulosiphila megalodicopiae TaxID=2724896 RepID=UPI003BAE79EB
MNINLRRVRSRRVGRAILYASFIKHVFLYIVFLLSGWSVMGVMGAMMLLFISASMYFESIEKRRYTFFLMLTSMLFYWIGAEILLGSQYGYHHVIWPLVVVMVLLDVLHGKPLYAMLGLCVAVLVGTYFLPEVGILNVASDNLMTFFNLFFLLVSCLIVIPVMVYFHQSNIEVLHKLNEQANTDELTSLYNRRRMLEDINLQQALSERNDGSFSLILGDIDFFKQLNDTFGHAAGDAALKHLAKLLKDTVRKTDSVSRWGGEEFLILLSGSHEKEALHFANTLRELVEKQKIEYDHKQLQITLSFGVAHYKMGQTIERTIHNADLALYQAKVHGRNRVVLHQPSMKHMPSSVKQNENAIKNNAHQKDVESV